MVHAPIDTNSSSTSPMGAINLSYVSLIACVAALGGLLFGYDWVVIGGAKPFYQSYFGLTSEVLIGWANSCALLGCFAGSLAAGRLSDWAGRRKVLVLSAFLFTVSSILTGWSYSFNAFIGWRILGGLAIGLSSNISPMYIAEVSPAAWRGRLVSLNQLALVIGILAAQIANWRIARPMAADIDAAAMLASWNVQYGWRWMFTAVAAPAIVFLIAAPFLPESPRWLVANGQSSKAADVLSKIGGSSYGAAELRSIESSIGKPHDAGSGWSALFSRRYFGIFAMGVGLAVLQQASGINILFNYAEEVYRSAGFGVGDVLFNIVITGTINLIFTVIAMLLVDRFGRRRLMLLGCLGVGACHIGASIAYTMHLAGALVLTLTLAAIACYAMTLAPITWVLISEIFPNRIRAAAVSGAVGMLWLSSFALTYTFPILVRYFGMSRTFLFYGAICILGAAFVMLWVPETKGRSLEDLEAANAASK